jgi:hypothetical protein
MSHRSGKNEPLTEEGLKSRVYQGLQKKKKCALCLQSFYVDELPGAITHKSILELRQKWGEDVRKGNKLPSPSQLYKREELCIFCMQFFDVDAPDANAATSNGSHGNTQTEKTRKTSPNATARSPSPKPSGSPKKADHQK